MESELWSPDIRIEVARDSSIHWRGRGILTHLPSGIVVEFEEKWNDRSEGRRRALNELAERLKQHAPLETAKSPDDA